MSSLMHSTATPLQKILGNFSYFQCLQKCDFDWLESVGIRKEYLTQTVLIDAGQTTEHIYICLSGNLVIMRSQSDGNQQELDRISVGELIGENALLDNPISTTKIVVTAPSEMLVLSKQKLVARLNLDTDFAARFYHLLAIKLSERLRQLTKLMATQNIKEGEPLRKVLVVFATLNDSDISWMIANGTAKKATLGTALIEQNRSVPALYLLLEGMLGIYVNIQDNGSTWEKEVAKRVKGDILGEMSFVDGGVASASVKALENAWVLALPQTALADKFQQDRGFASRFYRSLGLILFNRCLDLLSRAGLNCGQMEQSELLSEDIEAEDELDLDVLERTAIAGKRFDWMIQQVRR